MVFFKEAVNTLQALVDALGGGSGTWDNDTTPCNRPAEQRHTSRKNKNGGLIALARPPPRSNTKTEYQTPTVLHFPKTVGVFLRPGKKTDNKLKVRKKVYGIFQ